MKILGMKVSNFMGLKFLDLTPDATWNVLSGRNGQGKTSGLKAIRYGLGGPDQAPDKIVHQGADRTEIDIDLGDFVVKRRKSAEGPMTLKVESKTEKGKTFSKAQTMLSELIGRDVLAFDPIQFARMKPAEQAAKLRQITGLDTSALDAEAATVYAERTIVNRDVKALAAQVAALEIPEVPAEPGEDVNLSAILQESADAQIVNRKNDTLRREAKKIEEEIVIVVAQIAEAEKALKHLQEKRAGLVERHEKAKPIVAALKDVDLSDTAKRLQRAQDTNQVNAKIRQSRQAAIEKINAADELKQRLKEREQIAAAHTSRLDEIEREKKALFESVKMPVTGLAINGDVVSYNGVPLSDCSQSEQLRIGCAIATASNPGLDVLLLDGCEALDRQQLDDLQKWAKDQDVQIFATIVGDDVPGSVVIEKGRAKGRAAK